LLLALLVIVAGGAVTAAVLGWAGLQLRSGRAWRDAATASANSEALAAEWLDGGLAAAVRTWPIGDSLLLARVPWSAPGVATSLELLVRRAAPDSGATGNIWAEPAPPRGFLRPPR
jgi:hypothetical protein